MKKAITGALWGKLSRQYG